VKISIFGLGYVGIVSGACLAERGHEVVGVDIAAHKVEAVNAGACPIVEEGIAELVARTVAGGALRATTDAREAVEDSEVSLVSVGTPSAPNGTLSTEQVERVTREIALALRGKTGPHAVVFRSTVLPGTTEDILIPILTEGSGRRAGDGLEICFNPEFLREGASIRDFREPAMTVIGAETDAMRAIMASLHDGIVGPVFHTGYRAAESIKYMSNAFHAVKIAFANEMGALLRDAAVDPREVARIFCEDRVLNVGPAYLRPGFAFGGSCLPKDIRALLAMARDRDVTLPLLDSVLASNERHIDRAFRNIVACGQRDVALFGLSFKPGTDDLRESPLVTLAERLIGKGYRLRIYDPCVRAARLTGANRQYIEREIPHIEELLYDDPTVLLDGIGTVAIGHADADAVAAIAALPAGVPVIDLYGVANPAVSGRADYRGICW